MDATIVAVVGDSSDIKHAVIPGSLSATVWRTGTNPPSNISMTKTIRIINPNSNTAVTDGMSEAWRDMYGDENEPPASNGQLPQLPQLT